MLSRVVKDSSLEVKPVSWRRRVSAVSIPMSPAPIEPLPDEAAQLRARLTELTAEIDTQRREGYQAGFQAGESAARTNHQEELRCIAGQLADTITGLASTRAEAIHRAEVDTVRLAIEIARRILHRELSVDNSALEGLIKAALAKLQAQEIYRVRVHPDQAAIVRNCLDQAGRSQAIEIIPDASQPKGGAVFDLSRGALDASVETQLREIECGLADRMEATA